ncbi:S8 family serine peptidase [Streptomyces sp. DSM 44917]|uniref:S8 family serine peptidase n=1 Tax=Streptomyces boetiae TaxID=3075541 RepID=A0ABU2LEN1_9ACTN|nr:S8 family serine peptidase [Streptomyces sp. DSM 44917]MDT0309956.1 S8 family serine peptidase [Streptomyces sp. DSM 44917]
MAAALAAVLAAGAAAPAAEGRDPAAAPRDEGDGSRISHSVTLITGDRVLVDPEGGVAGVVPAEGREDVPRTVARGGGETLVLPLDAIGLIEDGTLDRDLFNITELSREQHREAGGLRIIVGYEENARQRDGARGALREAAEEDAARPLEAIDAEALTVSVEEAAAVWEAVTAPDGDARALAAAPGIASVALDGIVTAALDVSVPQIGAPQAWEAGFDGAGTTIAVLDTGIDETHPDLAGQVVGERNFSEAADAEDRDGHGTHVASTAAGTGAHSEGTYTGVAPGARLLNGKVLDDTGSGWQSDIVEGMEWAVEQGADVVNLSLGGPAGDTVDPLEEAVDRLSAESDTLFVIAAGNSGPEPGTVGSPGTADAALTVGAVDSSDAIADFSSVGPRTRDGALKPDVTAPGVDIAAAGAEGAAIWQYGTPVADGYAAISGTSMATPHVAGAAALLAQAHPDWTGERIKAALIASARPTPGEGAFRQGAGRIEVPAALEQTITAEPSSLSFGSVPWPPSGAEPVTRELTYRNDGTQDVTLDLSAATTGPDGAPAPEGLFTLGADEVTVPAGGTATVPVTATPAAAGETPGAFGLHVTATAEGVAAVTTAGAVTLEEETFQVEVDINAREGEADRTTWSGTATDLATGETRWIAGTEARATVPLPAGTYALNVFIETRTEDGLGFAGIDWLSHAGLEVTRDLRLTASADDARPMTLEGPNDDADQTDLDVGYDLIPQDGEGGAGFVVGTGAPPEGMRTAPLGGPAEGWELSAWTTSTWLTETSQYRLAHTRPEGFYTGHTLRAEARDMARITTGLGASTPGRLGVLYPFPANIPSSGSRVVELPHTTEVFLLAEAGPWQLVAEDFAEGWTSGAYLDSGQREYRAGRRYHETFNTGVFGPQIVEGAETPDGLYRTGDTLHGSLALFSDGGGHWGFSPREATTTTLYRNGEEYASMQDRLDAAPFTLPSEEADYRLVISAVRGEPAASVSTEVTAEYTFTSGGVGEDETVRLPASAVRFTPRLALDSTAPAGERLRVPVTVQGTAAGDYDSRLTVAVSYDRGETWRNVPVRRGAVQVTNPAAGGSVSFRAELVDGEGNTLTQTILDAYRTA